MFVRHAPPMHGHTTQSPTIEPQTLLVVAAPKEAEAVMRAFNEQPAGHHAHAPIPQEWRLHRLSETCTLVRSGIGKVNAAGAVLASLQSRPFRNVISIGIAGLLPQPGPDSPPRSLTLALGDAVLATASIYADEGLATPETFLSTAQMGFPLGPFPDPAVPATPDLLALLTPIAPAVGPVATVSTCSGADHLAASVVARTSAVAEAMEGAAVGHAVARWNQLAADRPPVRFAELRVVSNTTGDRPRQRWDLPLALERLTELTGRLRTLRLA